jgi:hypothetical protein
MRILIVSFVLLLFRTSVIGQDCHCDEDPTLNTFMPCDTTIFHNNAKLFWSFNCDSSWLTFRNSRDKRKVIFSLTKDFMELTKRIGYVGFQEFRRSFLVENRVISGCCQPSDYYLYGKITGNLLKYLGRAIFTSSQRNVPYIISVTNSNYDTASKANLNSLTIYNLDNNKEYKLPLPKGDIKKGMINNNYVYPEEVFDMPADVKDNKIVIKYSTQKHQKNKKFVYKIVLIDTTKYSS